MIEVRYEERARNMQISGHAGSGRYGHDLVCAAASILTLTLEETLRRAEALGAQSGKEPGWARVCASGEKKDEERTKAAYEMAFMGFALLEEQYPEYVKTERTEDRRET